MEGMITSKEIKNKISTGNISKALVLALKWSKQEGLGKSYSTHILWLTARWNRLKKETQKGIISSEEKELRENKFINYFLEFIDKEKSPPSWWNSVSRRFALPVVGGIWILILAGGIWLWQTKGDTAKVKIEILTKHMNYSTNEAGSFFSGQRIVAAQLQNYLPFEVPGDSLLVDFDLDKNWDTKLPINARLEFNPVNDGSVILQDVRLGDLKLPEQTTMSLESTGINRFNLDFADATGVEASFYLSDTLEFSSEENEIDGWEIDYYGDPFRGQIAFKSIPPNLNIQADELFHLSLSFDDSVKIHEGKMKVTSIDWNKIERDNKSRKPLSMIKKGKVNILTTGITIPIENEQYLKVRPAENFYLQEFILQSSGLKTIFTGELKLIATGNELDKLVDYMPNRLEKIWGEQKSYFIFFLGITFLLSVFLVYLKRQSIQSYEKLIYAA